MSSLSKEFQDKADAYEKKGSKSLSIIFSILSTLVGYCLDDEKPAVTENKPNDFTP